MKSSGTEIVAVKADERPSGLCSLMELNALKQHAQWSKFCIRSHESGEGDPLKRQRFKKIQKLLGEVRKLDHDMILFL